MKRELVRVERGSKSGRGVLRPTWSVFIGGVSVCTFNSSQGADVLAASISAELQKEFEARARWIAKESRYREVRHY